MIHVTTIQVWEEERRDSFEPYKIYIGKICRENDKSIRVEAGTLEDVFTDLAYILKTEESNA